MEVKVRLSKDEVKKAVSQYVLSALCRPDFKYQILFMDVNNKPYTDMDESFMEITLNKKET